MDIRSVLNTSDGADLTTPGPHPIRPRLQSQSQSPPHLLSQAQRVPSVSNPAVQAQGGHSLQQPRVSPRPSSLKLVPPPTATRPQPQHDSFYHQAAFSPTSPYQRTTTRSDRVTSSLQSTESVSNEHSPGSISAVAPLPSPYRTAATPSSTSTAAAGYPFPPPQTPRDITSPSSRYQPGPGDAPSPTHYHNQSGTAIASDDMRRHTPSQSSGSRLPSSAPPYTHRHFSPNQTQVPHIPPPAPRTPTAATTCQTRFDAVAPHHNLAGAATEGQSNIVAEHRYESSQTNASNSGHTSETAPHPLMSAHAVRTSDAYRTGVINNVSQVLLPAQGSHSRLVKPDATKPPPYSHTVHDRSEPSRFARADKPTSAQVQHQYGVTTSRDHSMSISPKTTMSPMPVLRNYPTTGLKSAGPAMPHSEEDELKLSQSSKRKLGESTSSSPGRERKQLRSASAGESRNGVENSMESISAIGSAAPPHGRRVRYTLPPPWAQSVRSMGKKPPKQPNFVLQQRQSVHIRSIRDVRNVPRSERSSPPLPSVTSAQTSRGRSSNAGQEDPQNILGGWEGSITGVKPYEEVPRKVADFLFIHLVNNPDLEEITKSQIQFEVEAKLGTLIDKDTGARVNKSVDSECILQDSGRTAFISSMTEAHHQAFNEFLNKIVVQTNPNNPNKDQGRVSVAYSHTREVDRFFDLPHSMLSHLPECMRARSGPRGRAARARITYNQQNRAAIKSIVKARVADLDLHLPTCPLDCRISINLEMDWSGSVRELEQLAESRHTETRLDRNKDRLSYSQGHYRVDLTQVAHTNDGVTRSEKEHELEIELATNAIIEQGRRAKRGQPHRYQELIEGFVDNVRVLARKARDIT